MNDVIGLQSYISILSYIFPIQMQHLMVLLNPQFILNNLFDLLH